MAEQGGATTPINPYEGGVGGKFRKKPARRQTTPYDRPINNSSRVGWLKNLVVDQASKLFAYGSNRLFGSVVPKPILPPQDDVVNHDAGEVGEVIPESAPNVQEELMVANCDHPIDSSNSNGISELEKLLKRNTFTRPEALRLIELLHSRAAEVVAAADESKNTETSSVFGRYDDNLNEGVKSHGATTSTPIFNSRVHEEDIGSPAELAKAYMGSRPSKVSPSMLGANHQVGRADTRLLNNIPFIGSSPILPLTRNNSSIVAAEDCFVTPRSRGRSALYNMARTPYSRVYPASSLKGGGNNNNDYGSSMPPRPILLTEHGEKTESKSTNLKRRSSDLDNEVGFGAGSVGPIRKIKQKQNLLVSRMPRTPRELGIDCAKQKHPSVEANHDRNENGSVASTSYASVPTRSTVVASKILQHLENMSPEKKSPGFKITAVMNKSPFKSAPGVVHEQGRRSVEDVGTSEFMLNGKDHGNMEDKSNTNVPDSRESTQNQEKVRETAGKGSVTPSNLWSSAKKTDASVMPLKVGTSDFLARDNASQQPQKRRAFRNGQEGGDVQYNGIAPVSLSKEKRPVEENNLSTVGGLKSLKATSQPEVKSASDYVFSKTSEFRALGSEKTGEGSNRIAVLASEETNKSSQYAVIPSPATVFDKPNDNPPSLFTFSSNAGDKFPPLTSEFSSKNPELKLDGASSFSNISAPNGFQKADIDIQKAADKIGKSDTTLPASNGLFGTDTSSGKSTLIPAATTSKSGIFGPTSSIPNNFQGSIHNTANFNAFSGESVPPQGSSSQPISSTSFPPFTNGSNAFGSSFSSLPPSNSNSVTPVSESIATSTKLGSSAPAASAPNTSSSFSNGASGITNFDGSSSTSTAPINPFTSFASTFNFSNPSTGFVFNSSPTPAPTNTAQPVVSSPSPSPSGSSIFQFAAASSPVISTPSVFGNSNPTFEASPIKNNDQMNAEDSMAEDPRQSSMSMFGQPAVPHSPPGFMFGQANPFQATPVQFGSQTNQATPNPFPVSNSLEFNAGGSGAAFSLGSGGGGGGDKSNRRSVKVNRKFKRK